MAVSSFISVLIALIFLTPAHFSHASRHTQHRLHSAARESRSSAANGGGMLPVELWCVAKNNAEDSALQSSLDWACGPGGADCGPIQQGGPCSDPADIRRTASYAFNDYFLKHGLTEDSCNFEGTAALTSLNPGYGKCKFPSSFSVNGQSSPGSSTTVGLGPASADINGSSNFAGTWCIFSITIFLLSVVALIL
ncbi:hypothetical protein NMG60_11032812 [Bertholletia excelsa]